MTYQPIKAQLVRLLQAARDLEINWTAGLSADQRKDEGSWERWSARDTLAHLGDWRLFIAGVLQKLQAGEEAVPRADFEVVNREIFERCHAWRWIEVEALAETSHRELMKALEQFSEEELVAEGRFPAWREGSPLWKTLHTYYYHSYLHCSYYVADEGDFAAGERMQQLLYEEECDLDDTPRSRGTALYNLACFYARGSDLERVLEQLDEAFRLAPDLKEWASKDSDLVKLHENAQFLALVGR